MTLTRHWILSLGLGAALTWAVPGDAATVKWFIAETNANQTAWMREVAKAYEAANPGTTIAIEVMAAEPYKGKLITIVLI
jgi:ABC-type glycerol-3-phosphate transport system substrate-binding protein